MGYTLISANMLVLQAHTRRVGAVGAGAGTRIGAAGGLSLQSYAPKPTTNPLQTSTRGQCDDHPHRDSPLLRAKENSPLNVQVSIGLGRALGRILQCNMVVGGTVGFRSLISEQLSKLSESVGNKWKLLQKFSPLKNRLSMSLRHLCTNLRHVNSYHFLKAPTKS